MPKIPTYTSQNNVSVAGMDTSVGVTDTTDAGLVGRAQEKLAKSFGGFGNALEAVEEKIKQNNDQIKTIAMNEILHKVDSEGLAHYNTIKTTQGQEALEANNKLREWDKTHKENDPLDLSNIDDNSSYAQKQLKKLGVTENEKALFNLKLAKIKDNYIADAVPYVKQAQEVVAVQSAQEATVLNRQKMLAGLMTIEDLNQGTAYDYMDIQQTIGEGKTREHIKQEWQSNTKLFLEDKFDKEDPQVVSDFLNGKYDNQILAGKGGVDMLDSLRNQAKRKQSEININTTYEKYLPEITNDFSKPTIDKVEKEINSSKLSDAEKKTTINMLNAERHDQIAKVEREKHEERKTSFNDVAQMELNKVPSAKIIKYINKTTLEPTDKLQLINHFKKSTEDGYGKSDEGVMATFQYALMKDPDNVAEADILKDTRLRPKDKIELIKMKETYASKAEKPEVVAATKIVDEFYKPVAGGDLKNEIAKGNKRLRIIKGIKEAVRNKQDPFAFVEKQIAGDKKDYISKIFDYVLSPLTSSTLFRDYRPTTPKRVKLQSGKYAVEKDGKWVSE